MSSLINVDYIELACYRSAKLRTGCDQDSSGNEFNRCLNGDYTSESDSRGISRHVSTERTTTTVTSLTSNSTTVSIPCKKKERVSSISLEQKWIAELNHKDTYEKFQDDFLNLLSVAQKSAENISMHNQVSDEVDFESSIDVEKNIKHALTVVDDSMAFLRLSTTVLRRALTTVAYSRSAASKVPPEIWSRIFRLSISPFDSVAYDYGFLHPSTDVASETGKRYCSPEVFLLVSKTWHNIALNTLSLWSTVSKAHVVLPVKTLTETQELSLMPLAKQLQSNPHVRRLFRVPARMDRLERRAPTFAARSGSAPLIVDLRCTSHPHKILRSLKNHFDRVDCLYIDKWTEKIATLLHTVDCLGTSSVHPAFPKLKTLSLTVPYQTNRDGQDAGAPAMFPAIFSNVPSLVHLRIGDQFNLRSLSFDNVPWSRLQVLELDEMHDKSDVLRVLKHCTSLQDLIITCPFVDLGEGWRSAKTTTDVVLLPSLRTMHYHCNSYFDTDLSLLECLEMPCIQVLSLHADLAYYAASWLESQKAEKLLLTKVFSGCWPHFTTLELLHLNGKKLSVVKAAVNRFGAKQSCGSPSRNVTIGFADTSDPHERRFQLCISGGVGGPERLTSRAALLDENENVLSRNLNPP